MSAITHRGANEPGMAEGRAKEDFPIEVKLLVVKNLPLEDIKRLRRVNRNWNAACRRKLWERIVIPLDLVLLEKRVYALEVLANRKRDRAAVEDGNGTPFVTGPIVVRDLEIVCPSDDSSRAQHIIELQARALELLVPVLRLKRFAFKPPLTMCMYIPLLRTEPFLLHILPYEELKRRKSNGCIPTQW